MSSFVGKKFPNLAVDAMNDMGDTFQVNVLEEATKNNKKVILFWYPKFYIRMSDRITCFSRSFTRI